MWQYGTYKPVENPWSWHTLTNIIYVEQPVGTGFTTGKTTITNEKELAAQFMGFWKNFIDTFSMQGYKVYISGESYAYVLLLVNPKLRTSVLTLHPAATTARTSPAHSSTPRTRHTTTCPA